jgi:polyisoprenoid-binding protein YceI
MKFTFAAALAASLLGTASLAAHAEIATYTIEPTHTFASFEISHFGTSTNRGRFDKKEGTVQFDRAAHVAKVDVTVDIGSLNTGYDAFTKHLKSAEILDAAQYPTAHFVGDKAVFDGENNLTEVSGLLTLHGKTQPVTFKADHFNCYLNPMLKREVCGGDFEANLVRSQFGVDYGLKFGSPDAMRLVIQVEAIKQ